jgi:hypothetical protein
MKRPAFMFYPSDWRSDAALQACKIESRGIWHELLCVMHECVPYGHLIVNGVAPTDSQAARMIGVELNKYKSCISELRAAGVPSWNDAGIMYSRRMVRDERIRTLRADAGSKGGNPALLKQRDNQNPGSKVNQFPTPSLAFAVDSIKKGDVVSTGTPPVAWFTTQAGIVAKAKSIGLEIGPAETIESLRDRTRAALKNLQGSG